MIIKQYLHGLYGNKALSHGIHLEGGAALSFYYGFERVFSNDLDFTYETAKDRARFLLDLSLPLGKDFYAKELSKHRSSIIERSTGNTLFSVDYYHAPSRFCDYETRPFEGKTNSKIHSLLDILTEKLFCLIERDTKRDVIDAAMILRSEKVNASELSSLFTLKQTVKLTNFNNLEEFVRGIFRLSEQKVAWGEVCQELQCIVNYLKK
ncbi:MAG: hypothetical protein CL685_04055 [Candidatus Magasanikbacteria bacterium]|nr:hypothetical protein [Candidatus Magasanikbacteria bacterium]|tara:strand:- start:4130 stop:4753 length:624 start_codon:yes stop_codon:yes gene_type:complete